MAAKRRPSSPRRFSPDASTMDPPSRSRTRVGLDGGLRGGRLGGEVARDIPLPTVGVVRDVRCRRRAEGASTARSSLERWALARELRAGAEPALSSAGLAAVERLGRTEGLAGLLCRTTGRGFGWGPRTRRSRCRARPRSTVAEQSEVSPGCYKTLRRDSRNVVSRATPR